MVTLDLLTTEGWSKSYCKVTQLCIQLASCLIHGWLDIDCPASWLMKWWWKELQWILKWVWTVPWCWAWGSQQCQVFVQPNPIHQPNPWSSKLFGTLEDPYISFPMVCPLGVRGNIHASDFSPKPRFGALAFARICHPPTPSLTPPAPPATGC